MITIKDLAKIANVSQSTISKALNNRPDVGEDTRKRILDIANKYEFTPHAFGKGLKNQSTGNLGVIFYRDLYPLSVNPFYSRVLEGIEAETAINNKNLLLQFVTEQHKVSLPKMVRERQVDGMIFIGSLRKEYLDLILEKNVAVVFIDPKYSMDCCSQVLIDNEHGAFQATQYLVNYGHRRVGFISGNLDRLSFVQRFKGYKKALKYHNIPFDEDLVQSGGLEKGYDHMQKLLQSKNRPTAVFAANDINAIYAYKAIKDAKLKIPDDISLVGFDDIEMAKMSSPPLSTVRVYKEEMGSIAVRILLQIFNNEIDKPTTTLVPTKLVERESVSIAK
jgi:LacI family transcriptional regulator